MIRGLVDFALNNRWLMIGAAVLLFAWGIVSFHSLPVEAYPDVANNYVQVITQWPGRAAEEVEQQVTVPIEIQMAGIPHLEHLRSTSLAGLSSVMLIFDDDSTDKDNRQEVFQRLGQVTLPAGLQPQMGTDWSPVGQIYWYTLRSTNPAYDSMELKSLEDWKLEKEFKSVPGVVDVSTLGLLPADADLKKLYDDLKKAFGDQWATFIVAYRQNGPQSTGQPAAGGGMSAPAATPAGGATPAAPATPAGAAMPARPATFGGMGAAASKTAASGKLDLSKKPAATLNSVLDLIGVRTSVTFEGSNRSTPLDSPFVEDLAAMNDYLPKLLDKTTTVAGPAIPGRINVNQAPRCVLAGIPGMTPDALDQIISKRIPDPAKAGRSHRYETWILTEGLVPLATMKTMLPFINAGGCVYRVNVVGFFDDRGPIARLEVFLNAAKPPTSVLFWRDVSHVAIGYTPSLANPGNISANREQ